ncbi:hypothetical protein [Nocardioides sp.]|uniref:hypothetical protein n=1 Tax=Nocardioides sp. TaxID=35761 RepID=UPI003784C59E
MRRTAAPARLLFPGRPPGHPLGPSLGPSLVLSLVLAAGLLTGCSGSDDPPSTAASSPSGGSSSASPTDDASTASGPALTLPHSTVSAPAGWKDTRQIVRGKVAVRSADSASFISLGEIEAFGSTAGPEELGRNRLAAEVSPRKPELLAPATLDGVPAYHVAGFVSEREYLEEYGAIRDDRIVTLTFSFDKSVPEEERRAVVDEVLPTFRWR